MNTSGIETKNYTKHYRYYSDNVTEYIYNSDKNLNLAEFEKILNEGKAYICGSIEFIKKQLRYASGKVMFQHVCKVSMSVN